MTLLSTLLASCGSGSERPASHSQAAQRTVLIADAWRVRVTVKPSRVGPLAIAVQNVARSRQTPPRPWITHDVELRNASHQTVTVGEERRSAFIGDGGHRRLLVADQGCGYSQGSPRAPVRDLVCSTVLLAPLTITPHSSGKLSITAYKALPGMDPLIAGTYVFREEIAFRAGSAKTLRHASLALAYEVAPT